MTRRYSAALLGAVAAATVLAPVGEASAQQLQDDTIRFATASISPAFGRPEQGTASPSVYTLWPLYDSLTMVNAKGDVSGLLAESWKNLDKGTWQVALRKGVKFHNGKELKAQHVAAQFAFVIDDKSSAGTVANSTNKQQAFITSAHAIDDYTVEFKTSSPNPEIPRQLAGFWIPETTVRDELGTADFSRKPVGTGPYMNPQWTGGVDGSVDWVAFPDALRKPKVKNLRIVALGESATRVAGVLSNQIDIAQGVPFDAKGRLETAGHKMDIADRPSVLGWRFMSVREKSPFRDKRVRQAANYAIDRAGMASSLLGNTSVPQGQCATRNTFGFNPAVTAYPYDPAKAKALLAEAGYPNGFKTEVETVVGSFPADSEIYQLAGLQLSAVGIDTKVTPITFPDWLDKWFGRKKAPDGTMGFTDIFSNACHNFNAIPFDAYPNMTCKKELASHCDRDETALLDRAMGEFDVDKRRGLIQELMAVNKDQAQNLFFVELTDLTGIHRRVQGFTNTIQRFSFENITLTR
ncbi:MAG: ABC transporter substrate-binding protein [Alphaproteobacteria bacterium]|nr:ABC transporter substrate-binding protein [Alphaproteobacteria bacterium]